MTETKRCPGCEEVKSIAEFSKNSTRYDGLQAYCKLCYSTKGREYYQRNIDQQRARSKERYKANPEQAWARHILRNFNLSPSGYEQLLASQGGVCAICGTKPRNRRLAVDHDHSCCPGKGKSCGKCIRGLLCVTCNRKVLGGAERTYKDKAKPIAILRRAIEYLERGPVETADSEGTRTLRRAA